MQFLRRNHATPQGAIAPDSPSTSPPADARAAGNQRWMQLGLGLLVNIALVGGALLSVGAVASFQAGDLPLLALILAFTVVAERLDIGAYGRASVSVSVAGVIAALVLTGADGAILLAGATALAGDVGRARPLRAVFFNFGSMVVAAAVGGAVYIGAADALNDGRNFIMLGPALLAAFVIYMIESLMVALAISLQEERPIKAVWDQKFQWGVPYHMALGGLGGITAIAYETMGPIGVLAFLTPPLMLRYGMKQFVDQTSRTITELEDSNRELAGANRAIRKISSELERSYRETLEALMGALDARDNDTHGHSGRVQALTLDLAQEIGLNEDSSEWEVIRHGSLLHDIGKIAVSDNILRKPAALTEEEWKEMKLHPGAGATLLNQVTFLKGAAELVFSHHERWDGRGYPRGLKGPDIPLGARLFMIADTYDAMTHDRVYRKAQSPEAARDEIVRCGGSQFDPDVVEAFLRVFPRWAAQTRRRIKQEGQAA